MRKDLILFLSFLVDAGYIMAFRVTKDNPRPKEKPEETEEISLPIDNA